MITRQEYEKACNEFKANRASLSVSDFDTAKAKLNKMFKDMQIAEAVQSFKAGDKIESQTFLWLCKVYNVEINESFNDLMQNSVVSVSTSGYDSYKISKQQFKQLQAFIIKLLEAIQ
jgi:hypothetical protein